MQQMDNKYKTIKFYIQNSDFLQHWALVKFA